VIRARAWLFSTLALSLGFGCGDDTSSDVPQDPELGGNVAAAGKASAGSASSFAGRAGHANGAVGGRGGAVEAADGGAPLASVAGQHAGGEGAGGGDESEPGGCAGDGGDSGIAGRGGATQVAGAAGTGNVAGSGVGGSAGGSGVAGAADTGGAPASRSLPCEVQAVLKARCSTCHGSPPANNAPMSLLTWSNFQAYAVEIEEKLGAGAMPPPGAPELSTAQLSTLQNYLSLGTPPATNVSCP